MQLIRKSNKIPNNSLILQDIKGFDYCDSFQIIRNVNDTIDKITTEIFIVPEWVDSMMRFRNSIVRLFGLKGGDKRNVNIVEYYSIGSKAIYFTVIDRNDNEIVMAENDKHLNFRVSILLERGEINSNVTFTTIVKFNNVLGRLYFLIILPFHRLIIKSLLKRTLLLNKNYNGD